jgi:hypothetical protein
VAVAACGGKTPEADPAKVAELVTKIARGLPGPGGVGPCTDEQLTGGFGLTMLTVRQLSKSLKVPPGDATYLPWVNPSELDGPAARTMLESTDETEKRRAAAQLLAAPFYVVYRTDTVDTPIALGITQPKLGTVTARAIRYDKSGNPVCLRIFGFQSDKAKHDWAVEKTNGATVDPAVAKALQDDLHHQYLVWTTPVPHTTDHPIGVGKN